MSNNIQRAIRARKAANNETYSTARMHVVGESRGGGEPPQSGVVAVIERLIPVVEDAKREGRRLARRFGVEHVLIPDSPNGQAYLQAGRPRAARLEQELLALDDETRLKVLAVMYAGRDDNGDIKASYYELLPSFVQAEHVVSQITQKRDLLEHLRDGLRIAREHHVDLDEHWPFVPSTALADPSGADPQWLRAYGGGRPIAAALRTQLDTVARAARSANRETLGVLVRDVRARFAEEGVRLARVVADAEGHKANDRGYVLAVVGAVFGAVAG
ncbi:MAG: hypothetical protein V4850_30590 [Myxococcota bacterium]